MLHHLRISEGLVAWILNHRALLLVCFALLTILAVDTTRLAPIRVSILQGLMPDERQYQAYRERASMLGGDSDDLIYVATREDDKLFTPPVLNAIRAAAGDLEALPEIAHVFSIVDSPRLTPDARLSAPEVALRTIVRGRLESGQVPDFERESIRLPMYWPQSDGLQRKVDLSALKAAMRKDPIAGRLLSRDATAHTMLIWLADSSRLQNKPRSGVRQSIEDVLKRRQLGRGGIFCSGMLVTQDWMFDEVIRAFVLVLPVVGLIVCVLVYATFRRLSYVLLTLSIAAIAIVWSLGVVVALFGKITLLVAAAPALILIISTADTIHLASAYVTELNHGLSRDQAIRKVTREVGGACLLTSLTTFVGFLSLAVVPAMSLRHMAVACAVGVASALLLALTLVPMALSVLKPPPVGVLSRSLINTLLTKLVECCRRFSLGFPRTVVAVHLLIVVGAVYVISRMEYDADLPARFSPTHPLRQSIDFFNQEMFGTSIVEIIIRTDSSELLSPATVSGLAEFERRLAELSEVRDVISILAAFRVTDDLIGLESANGLPKTKNTASAIVEVMHRISPGAIDGLISREAGLTRVAVRVTSTRVLKILEFSERLQAIGEECLPDDAQVEVSGYYSVVGSTVREVLRGQVQGFFLCFVSVMTVVGLGVRSFRLSLVAVLPNLFPLVLLGGILGLTFDVVDLDVLGIAIVGFGLAVDDTIHFLHRYDIERAGGNRKTALEKTFRYTGSAIVCTTLILGLGLLPFALSSYLSIRLMGTYLVFVLGCAVLGDLLLLPALVLLFGEKNNDQSSFVLGASVFGRRGSGRGRVG